MYIEHLIKYGYLDKRLKNYQPAIGRALKLYKSFFRDDLISCESFSDDGLFDEATKAHMELPRCGCADFLGGEVLGGSGSWPQGCHGSDPFHQVNIYFNKSGMPKWWEPVFEEAFDLVDAAYTDMGCNLVQVKSKSEANITVTWERGFGWIGLAQVGRNHRCTTTYWAKFDNRYGSSFDQQQAINQFAMLLAHEFGHNFGFSHSRGGIMNPTLSRFKFTERAWRGDPYESAMTRWFGGIPADSPGFTTTTPEPITQPPPSPGNKLSTGVVQTDDGLILTGIGDKPTTLTVGGKTYYGVSL